jgi:transcriptional regulator with XRE-family HTH domain
MTDATRRSRKSPGTVNGRRTRAVLRAALVELDRARRDAGISLRRLAAESGVSQGFLSQIFAGDREPSVSVLSAITHALGGDLSIRFYPTTGPHIHDRIQSRIVEELLQIADPSWRRSVELPVVRPARGFIDLVLDRPRPPDVIATEVRSRLDRLEQSIRWSQDKAGALPSSDLWRSIDGDPTVHRLLVLRSTADTREIARRFESTLRAAYPARSADVHAALTGPDRPWPGHGILWADVWGDTVRVLDHPPRGVELGG